VQSPDEVKFDPDTSDHLEQAKAWLKDVPSDLLGDCVKLLNRLEAWSMYFTKGVADHEIAFAPCAPVFCGIVVRYYAVLLVARAGHASGKYPNLIEVFKDWRGQIESQKDGIKMKELVQSMKDLQARRGRGTGLQPPLGTGSD
jgi:hypothetical protein